MRTRRLKKSVKFIILLVLTGLFCIGTSVTYLYLASPIDKNNNKEIEVKIKEGMSTHEIASMLKDKGLIRNSTFFLVYSKLNKCSSLKASTYGLKKSMSLNTIFETICNGDYEKDAITITFKEGKRITDYAKVISKYTDNSYDDVINKMKDTTYIDSLINKYDFLTEEIKNPDIYYPLEGYLFPDTYKFKNKEVSVEEIVEVMLDEYDKVISEYKDKMTNYTVHEYTTLASMTELEGTNTENRKMIAGIFINRLNAKMALGSDVTTYYALQKDMTADLTVEEFNTSNPYNTRNINKLGLPVGPICSVSKSAIEAAVEPTQTKYLYFVADKNGKIYYTSNQVEHDQKVSELKKSGDWIW